MTRNVLLQVDQGAFVAQPALIPGIDYTRLDKKIEEYHLYKYVKQPERAVTFKKAVAVKKEKEIPLIAHLKAMDLVSYQFKHDNKPYLADFAPVPYKDKWTTCMRREKLEALGFTTEDVCLVLRVYNQGVPNKHKKTVTIDFTGVAVMESTEEEDDIVCVPGEGANSHSANIAAVEPCALAGGWPEFQALVLDYMEFCATDWKSAHEGRYVTLSTVRALKEQVMMLAFPPGASHSSMQRQVSINGAPATCMLKHIPATTYGEGACGAALKQHPILSQKYLPSQIGRAHGIMISKISGHRHKFSAVIESYTTVHSFPRGAFGNV